ncbi:hypothetical protein LIER_37530 [Lithospermum erythrorhizon]|uniref:Uncharacterized protein n=1 Tax=Lithospermum erythrorhizon TaxID=34254 RepID=A0AAV3PQP5_LITER
MVETGTGLNQQLSLARAGDTRWGSHYRVLPKLKKMFTPIVEVLEELKYDRTASEAKGLLLLMKQFDFVFMLHLMTDILVVTNESSQALQMSDQDILKAMQLVEVTFDTKSIVKMARLYPNDFDDVKDEELTTQLEVYIHCVQTDANFSNLKGLSELCRTLVRTKKHKTFRFVYKRSWL